MSKLRDRARTAQQSLAPRDVQRGIERGDRVRVLRARIDVALCRADREAGDRHALDQHERIAFHQHAVGECAGIAFVGVADDELALARRVGGGLPLDAGREPRAAATAQSRLRHQFDRCGRSDLDARARCPSARHARDSRPATADRRCRSGRRSAASAGRGKGISSGRPRRSGCCPPASMPAPSRPEMSATVTGP